MPLNTDYKSILLKTKIREIPSITEHNSNLDLKNFEYLDKNIGDIGMILHNINSGSGGEENE